MKVSDALSAVAVCVMTLNEEENIEQCIEDIRIVGIKKISVYDGGSTDNTVDLVRRLGIEVHSISGSSLTERRQIATLRCESEFLFFVDADHRIASLKGRLGQIILSNFDNSQIAGLMFTKRAQDSDYWSRGFEFRCAEFLNTQHSPKVIGMPCIYRTALLKEHGFDTRATGSIDDTTLCYRLYESGYRFKVVKDSVVEVFRSSLVRTVLKGYWYGLGDSEFVIISPGNRARHIYHVLFRNLLLHSVATLIKRPIYFPFIALFGCSRALGMAIGFLRRGDFSGTKS